MFKPSVTAVKSFSTAAYSAPVTALHFSNGRLFTGEGPYLHVYEYKITSIKEPSHSLQLFRAANIHGIVSGIQHRSLCVHGGKSFCVVEINEDSGSFNVKKPEVELEDWIWDVRWLNCDEVSKSPLLALALAHNSVILWDWQNSAVLQRVHCQEKCILYTALLLGDQWEDAVMAAGTVFNQVVLWGMAGDADDEGRVPAMHRLDGHDGVIFSVQYDPKRHLLCTVSDDRSLMLWRICWRHEPRSRPRLPDWSTAEFSLVHRLYGHAARVWDVRFLPDRLVSVGEDAKCCVWSSEEGLIMNSFEGHQGKSIWSLDVDVEAELIATGGGDGAICLWQLDAARESDLDCIVSRALVPPADSSASAEQQWMPRIVRLFGPDRVLIMTDSGLLLSHQLSSGEWHVLLNDESYRSYSVLEPNVEAKVIAVGNIHGKILLIHSSGHQIEKTVYSGKVFSLCWLLGRCHQNGSAPWHLLSCGPSGHVILWMIDFNTVTGPSLIPGAQFELPASKQRWITSATMISGDPYLVCGDRMGSIHVYDIEQSRQGQQDAKENSSITLASNHPNDKPLQSFWKLHGKAGVTYICYHNNHIFSCGRDGQYRQYVVEDGHLVLLHSNKVYKGFEWIAGLKFSADDMLVLGFHTNNFVVYSTNTHQRLLSIDCGGGHRAWDLSLSDDIDSATFVYIKAKDVMVASTEIHNIHTKLKSGLHGREVMDIKYLFSLPVDGADEVEHVCATASEDTLINIIAIPSSNNVDESSASLPGCVKVLLSLPGHISSVRCLATSPSFQSKCAKTMRTSESNTVQLVFSAGGRAQMKCWRIHSSDILSNASHNDKMTFDSYTDCKYSHPTSTTSDSASVWHEHLFTYLLHHKGLKRSKPWGVAQYDSDPETRFMDLTVHPLDRLTSDESHRHLHLVAAACSDAFLRVFCFDEQKRILSVIAELSFHEHCVLKVRHIIHTTDHGQKRLYILSAGTDGNVAFWSLTDAVKQFLGHYLRQDEKDVEEEPEEDVITPCHVIRAHQSGINALAVKHIQGSEYMLVSGGDDNALNIFTVNVDEFSVTSLTCACVRSAHATQITGAHICDRNTVITTSIDQRLITWKVDTQDSSKVKMDSCQYVHVADIANLESWMLRDSLFVSVCGVGLEVLQK